MAKHSSPHRETRAGGDEGRPSWSTSTHIVKTSHSFQLPAPTSFHPSPCFSSTFSSVRSFSIHPTQCKRHIPDRRRCFSFPPAAFAVLIPARRTTPIPLFNNRQTRTKSPSIVWKKQLTKRKFGSFGDTVRRWIREFLLAFGLSVERVASHCARVCLSSLFTILPILVVP